MAIIDSSSKPDRSDHARLAAKCAIASRILLLSLIVIWRSLVDPYDTSALLNPNCLSSSSNFDASNDAAVPPLWHSIGSKIEASIVWDGVYFIRIAQCGYEYEQTYAFLPLFPICTRLLSLSVFRPLVPLIGLRAVLGLSGYLLNIAAFFAAALYMYKLSLIILKDSDASLRAAILFCFNPASIFYSSVYSESLYSLLSVGGLYHLLSGENSLAVILFALSGSTRSNGILNTGYICFQTMHCAYDAMFRQKSAFVTMKFLILGALQSVCILVPFAAFQAYGYYNICRRSIPDEMSPWCSARLPLLYNYIQSHYWGVGFLKYFQLKQFPNFLLASPILSLAICTILYYVRLQPGLFTSLGFKASIDEKTDCFSLAADQRKNVSSSVDTHTFSIKKDNQSLRQRKILRGSEENVNSDCEESTPSRYCSIYVVPFILHLAFMVSTAFLVMHVQVSTRFLSASPPLYWFASHIIASKGINKKWASWIWTYSAAYILLGSLLFSNFYPFT